jgi:hypothetical protein
VDANSHTNFSLPPARASVFYFPAQLPPQNSKSKPLSPLSAHVPHHLSNSHSPFLPLALYLSQTLPLPLTVSLTPAERFWPPAKKNRPCSPSVARKTFGNFFFPPPPTTSRLGTPSSSRSTRPPGLPSSL